MATQNIYINADSANKALDNLDIRFKNLQKKKVTIGLDVDDKKAEKYIQTLHKYIDQLKEKERLESKKISGKATQSELKAYNDICEAISLTNKSLNSQTTQMNNIDKILTSQVTRVKSYKEAQVELNRAKQEEVQTIKNANKVSREKEQADRKANTERQNAIKETTRLLKQQQEEQKKADAQRQREIDKMNQKAKDVGSVSKSMLQNESLNTSGSKRTQAQWEYQIETLNRYLSLIRKTEGAQEQYNHALQSMVYEVKHVTGKSLFQDILDTTKSITKAENERFRAQKNGQHIMEQYHTKELQQLEQKLQKLKEVAMASTPEGKQQLRSMLENNRDLIANSITDDVDRQEFLAMFDNTGKLVKAISDGMASYVLKLEESITKQKEKNSELMKQYNYEQKEKEYLSLLQQKFQLENKITNLSKDSKSTKQNQNQIQEYKKQIQLINEKLEGVKKETQFTSATENKIRKVTQAHRDEQAAIQAKNKDMEKSNGLLSGTLGNFMKFTAYYAALNALRQGINKALETMKELDAAFTDIRIVTGDSVEDTNQLAKEYNQLAKEIGSTTTDVAEGASEWLRQGRSAEETTELLRTSMTLSKVGAIESSEATELLTSSLNGYQIAAKDAMSIVDKMSAVDLAAATSTKELATALARTANIANDSNVSFDKLIAMIGTVSSVTRRSAETIRRII